MLVPLILASSLIATAEAATIRGRLPGRGTRSRVFRQRYRTLPRPCDPASIHARGSTMVGQGHFTAPAKRLAQSTPADAGGDLTDCFSPATEEPPLTERATSRLAITLGKVADMPTKRTTETTGSPVPGVIPAPVRVHHEPPAADEHPDATPAKSDPGAERDARRQERDSRRGPSERPGVMIPNRRKRLPLEAPLMRAVASAGIVGIAVAIAAIMGSQGSQAWLIGLVVSIASIVLAAVLWSSRRL